MSEMKINVDHEQIQRAMDEHVGKAVESALSSYGFQKQIEESFVSHMVEGAIGEAMQSAFNRVNMEDLSDTMSAELTEIASRATVSIFAGVFAEMIARTQGAQSFQSDYEEKISVIRDRLMGRVGDKEVTK